MNRSGHPNVADWNLKNSTYHMMREHTFDEHHGWTQSLSR